VPDPDEGTPEGHAYPTRSRREALDQGKLSRLGACVGDPLSGYELIQVRVHGRLLLTEHVTASPMPSRAPGWTHICANGVQPYLAAAAHPAGGALDIPGT
jgi:hypothetical protein